MLPESISLIQNLLSTSDQKLSDILVELRKLRSIEDGFEFSKLYLKRLSGITATAKKADNTPDYEIKSLDSAIIIKSIAIVPDDNFRVHGIILVEINGIPFLDATTAGDFTDIDSFTIPLPEEGMVLQRSSKIRFYLWTDDGTSSALTITALVSKDVPKPI